jgi:hypothetical protein
MKRVDAVPIHEARKTRRSTHLCVACRVAKIPGGSAVCVFEAARGTHGVDKVIGRLYPRSASARPSPVTASPLTTSVSGATREARCAGVRARQAMASLTKSPYEPRAYVAAGSRDENQADWTCGLDV